MSNLFRVRNFWYESNEGLIKDFKEGARVKKSLDSIAHISLDNPLKILEEEDRCHQVQELCKDPFGKLSLLSRGWICLYLGAKAIVL